MGVKEAADSKVRVIRLGVSHAEKSTTSFKNQNELQPPLTFHLLEDHISFQSVGSPSLLSCFLPFHNQGVC